MIRRIRCVLAVATALSGSSAGLGLGLGIKPIWLAASLIGLILLVMFIGDHPRVLPAHWHQTVILDRALAEDGELHVRLEEVMDGKVHRWRPLRLQPRSPECGSRAADHRNDPGLPHRRPALATPFTTAAPRYTGAASPASIPTTLYHLPHVFDRRSITYRTFLTDALSLSSRK